MADRIQHCFGEYERKFCNGDANSDDIYEKLPCNRRDICEAFHLYLKEVGKSRIEYFSIKSEEGEAGEKVFYADLEDEKAFVEFCGKLVDRYGTYAKRIRKKRYKVVERPKKKTTESKAKKKTRKLRNEKLILDRSEFLDQLLENFRIELTVKLPLGRGVVEDGVLPLPGQLFLVNRTGFLRRSAVSLYLKGFASKDLEIVRLIPRYSQWKFFAIILFEKDYIEYYLSKELIEFLEIKSFGKYCKTKNLDRVGISLLSEAICVFFMERAINVRAMVES